MSLTLTAEPEIIDGARSYAARSGMTLEAFVLAYLETAARRERKRCEPSRPAWAGVCEGAITRNFFGPHDISSIRESIASAERVSGVGFVDRLIHGESEQKGMVVLSCEKSFRRLSNAEVIP